MPTLLMLIQSPSVFTILSNKMTSNKTIWCALIALWGVTDVGHGVALSSEGKRCCGNPAQAHPPTRSFLDIKLKILCLIKHGYKDGQKWTQHGQDVHRERNGGRKVKLFLVLRPAVKVVVRDFRCASAVLKKVKFQTYALVRARVARVTISRSLWHGKIAGVHENSDIWIDTVSSCIEMYLFSL